MQIIVIAWSFSSDQPSISKKNFLVHYICCIFELVTRMKNIDGNDLPVTPPSFNCSQWQNNI